MSKTHYESLFQLYMTLEDVKALMKAMLLTDDPANELLTRCGNIIHEIQDHLDESNFKKPNKR